MLRGDWRAMCRCHATALLVAQLVRLAQATELASCYQQYDVEVFHGSSCPAACPYTMTCDSEARRMCIPRDDCGLILRDALAIDEPAVGKEYLGYRCETVATLGCGAWASGTCQACAAEGYTYDEKEEVCILDNERWFRLIIFVCLILVLWILLDFCRASWGPTRNGYAIREGVKARFRSQFRQLDQLNCPPHPLNAQLHKTFIEKEVGQPIGGPGLVMFMNWFCLVIPLGIWLCIGAFIYAAPETTEPCEYAVPEEATVASSTGNATMSVAWTYSTSGRYEWAMWNYVGACIMTAIFLVHQELLWSNMTNRVRGDASMHRYCVELRGFPPSATNNEQVANFVKKELRHWALPETALLYVSIAFAYPRSDQYAIEQALDANLRRAKRRYYFTRSRDVDNESSDDESVAPWAGPFWIRFIAWVMMGAPLRYTRSARDDSDHDEPCIVDDVIEHLPASGTVFAVFETEPAATAFQTIGQCHTRWFDVQNDADEEYPTTIYTHNCKVDPASIRWQDYFKDTFNAKCGRMAVGAIQLVALLLLWTYIYAMFTEFVVKSKYVASAWAAMLELMMGIPIFVGNASLAYAVQSVTEYVGFKNRENILLAQLCLVVPIVGLNTIVDLYIARILAATHMANYNWLQTFTVDIAKLWEPFDLNGYNPYSNDLQTELTALAPTYVALPYLLEPIGTVWLPLLIGIWRIKQDTRVTPEEAARWLMPPELELVNPPYNDIINVTNFVIYSFWVLPGTYHRTMFPYYLGFGLLLYGQMRIRILRMQAYTFFGSNRLHTATCYLWAIPLSFMAACVSKEAYDPDGQNHIATPYGFVSAIFHVCIHVAIVAFVLPSFRRSVVASDSTYQEETGQDRTQQAPIEGKPVALATYFNTNPIEVLKAEAAVLLGRDIVVLEDLPVFYRLDMAYLQPCANHTFVNEEKYQQMMETGPIWSCLATNAAKPCTKGSVSSSDDDWGNEH